MTRRDYEKIADALADNIRDPGGLAQVIEALAPAFRRDNPRFDRERFRARVMRHISTPVSLVPLPPIPARYGRAASVSLSPVASRMWSARVEHPALTDYVEGE